MLSKNRLIKLLLVVVFIISNLGIQVTTLAINPLVVAYKEVVNIGNGATMEVYVQMPKVNENVTGTKKFPAMVYLHDVAGATKISTLLSNPGAEDFWPGYISQNLEIPIFVIAPKFSGATIDWTTKAAAVIKVLAAMQAKYNIESTRLFVGGNAEGADGAFYVAQAGQYAAPAISFAGLFETNPTKLPSYDAINSMFQKGIWIMQGSGNKNFDIGEQLATRCYSKSTDVTYIQTNTKDTFVPMMFDESLISFMISRPGSKVGTTVLFPMASAVPQSQIASGKSSSDQPYNIYFPNILGVTDYTMSSPVKYPMVIEFFGSGGMEGPGLNFLPSNFQKPFFKLFPRDKSGNVSLQSPAEVAKMVDELVAKYPIDPDKVSLIGYSLGGINVFDNIRAYPDKYASIVPSNGSASSWGMDYGDLYKFSHVPILITHDVNDSNGIVSYYKNQIAFSHFTQLGSNVTFMSQMLNSVHQPRVDNRGIGVFAWMLRQDRKNNINKGVPTDYKLPVPKLNLFKNSDYIISGTISPYTQITISGAALNTNQFSDSKGNFSFSIPTQPALGTVYNLVVQGLYGTNGPVTPVTLIDGTPPSAPHVNALKPLCKVLTGKTSAGFDVIVRNGSKIVAAKKAYSNGSFSIAIPGYKPGVELLVSVKNTYGIEGDPEFVTVSGLAIPKVNLIKPYAKLVTGTSEIGSTVFVKYNGKNIAFGKTSSKGKFSIKIKGYKKGAKLYVYAKNAYGYVSKSRMVAVK